MTWDPCRYCRRSNGRASAGADRGGLARLRALGARGCCLVGHPAYYTKFGFRNASDLAVEGVPPEVFFALAFDGEAAARASSPSTKASRQPADDRIAHGLRPRIRRIRLRSAGRCRTHRLPKMFGEAAVPRKQRSLRWSATTNCSSSRPPGGGRSSAGSSKACLSRRQAVVPDRGSARRPRFPGPADPRHACRTAPPGEKSRGRGSPRRKVSVAMRRTGTISPVFRHHRTPNDKKRRALTDCCLFCRAAGGFRPAGAADHLDGIVPLAGRPGRGQTEGDADRHAMLYFGDHDN